MNHDSFIEPLAGLFARDVTAFITELERVPDAALWMVPDGVSNSAGVLAQHLVGNLNHFIGHALGKSGYVRTRDQEFLPSEKRKEDLIADLERTREMVSHTLRGIDDETLAAPFPIAIPFELTTTGFLLQLYHHLAYHLGQLNYLRRMLR